MRRTTWGAWGEIISSGRHQHVKEMWGHWGPVGHKRGRDIQGQRHRPGVRGKQHIVVSCGLTFTE